MKSIVIRTLILSVALSATIYGIFALKSDYGSTIFEAFGFGLHSKNYVSWCQQRVAKIEILTEEPLVVFEESRKWIGQRSEKDQFEINYLSMERWLGTYCQVNVNESSNQIPLDAELVPILRIELLDGTKKSFFLLADGRYFLKGRAFRSEEFDEGLKALGGFFGAPDWLKAKLSK
jgi:hypothetical protein